MACHAGKSVVLPLELLSRDSATDAARLAMHLLGRVPTDRVAGGGHASDGTTPGA